MGVGGNALGVASAPQTPLPTGVAGAAQWLLRGKAPNRERHNPVELLGGVWIEG
jgi:hypothetical protein